MTRTAPKPVDRKSDAAKSASWSDYDPYFSPRKAPAGSQGRPAAPALNRSNSPYFPRLPGVSQG